MSAWYRPMPGETLPCNGFLITPENPGHVFIVSCSSKITPGDTGNVLAQTKDQPWRVERQCVSTGAALPSARGSLSQSGKFLDLPEMHRAAGLQGCKEGLS